MLQNERSSRAKPLPLISVVVPVYNVENYLAQCLDSLLAQTYQNIEIIIVQDGSSDSSPFICKEYEKKDRRVRLIEQSNEGLSSARNKGLSVCAGSYVCFVDSDDWVAENYISSLFAAFTDESIDVVECGFIKCYDDQRPDEQYALKKTKVFTREEWLCQAGLKGFLTEVAWGKLYRFSLWNNVSFPLGRFFEDDATIYKIIAKCKKVVRISGSYYYYRQRPNSIMNSNMTTKKIEDEYFALYEKTMFFFNEPTVFDFCHSRLMIYLIRIRRHYYSLVSQKLLTEFRMVFLNYKAKVIKSPNVPFKRKVYIFFFGRI